MDVSEPTGLEASEVLTDRGWTQSQKTAKLVNGETGVANDTAHGYRVDRVVTRNSENASAIAHDDMLALPCNTKSGFF